MPPNRKSGAAELDRLREGWLNPAGVSAAELGMVFWLLAMLVLWKIFGSMIQSNPWS